MELAQYLQTYNHCSYTMKQFPFKIKSIQVDGGSEFRKYFEEAARLGSNDAAVNLAIIYLGDSKKNKTSSDWQKIYFWIF